jgi:hypothetical protein
LKDYYENKSRSRPFGDCVSVGTDGGSYAQRRVFSISQLPPFSADVCRWCIFSTDFSSIATVEETSV